MKKSWPNKEIKRECQPSSSKTKKTIDSLINKTVSYLDKEFTKSIFQAEERNVNAQSQLISKATVLIRKSMSKSEAKKL